MCECEFVVTGQVFEILMYVWEKYSHLKQVFQRQEHITWKNVTIKILGELAGQKIPVCQKILVRPEVCHLMDRLRRTCLWRITEIKDQNLKSEGKWQIVRITSQMSTCQVSCKWRQQVTPSLLCILICTGILK